MIWYTIWFIAGVIAALGVFYEEARVILTFKDFQFTGKDLLTFIGITLFGACSLAIVLFMGLFILFSENLVIFTIRKKG
jgi:hypothetical protein